MFRLIALVTFFFFGSFGFSQINRLETEEWETFFEQKKYEEKALEFTDETFWEINDGYTYYAKYPVLLIYADGTSLVINWSFEGLDHLILKKEALTDEHFERYEKENIAYMVFDGILLKNPLVGNMISGDFMIVYRHGPISIYREYYTSPITREYVQSVLSPYLLGEPVQNFYLGSLKKKMIKLVQDYPRLAKKVKDDIIGYQGQDDDILRIADEYNQWTAENYPYRFADHDAMFWQEPNY